MKLLLILLLVSCGQARKETSKEAENSELSLTSAKVDDSTEFTAIKSRFFDEALRHNVTNAKPSSIVWGETMANAAAQCMFDHYKITVNRTAWSRLNHYEREYVIFHEMGHCSLRRRDHVTAYPSMMNTSMANDGAIFYIDNRRELLEELFTKRNTL